MKILLDNVSLGSTTGPNHFGTKLKKYLEKRGDSINSGIPDVQLSFIEATQRFGNIPMVQRLDGIYFNKMFDFNAQNKNILNTYNNAAGVVFQTEFNRRLTFKYFGHHPNSIVIRNGADLEMINSVDPLENDITKRYKKVWSCASSWRPHKRLKDNIDYFLENSKEDECLIVAGDTPEIVKNDRVFYVGNLNIANLIALYKASDYFIHLAWLDHCPNVVVDARASGCKIICSSSGGTAEIAGTDAIVVSEVRKWDLSPVDLYSPPDMKYNLKQKNHREQSPIDMSFVADQYHSFLKKVVENK